VRKRSSLFAEKGYAGQMEAFFSTLQNDKPADIGVRDGARATIGCLRMLDSARTLRTCAIDLDAVLDGSAQ